MRAPALLLLAAGAAWAQGTTPRSKAAEYPVHGVAGSVAIGAEYMVRSISGQGAMFVARDYLVVEVALYPDPDHPLDVNAGRFTLRLNGKKNVLLPQAPAMVAASLKYADWEQRTNLEATAGAGNVGVIVGRPRSQERFPGDRRGEDRLPAPPRAPGQEDPSGQEKREPVRAEDVAVTAALPEGRARGPVGGYLYFAYKGKAGSLKSVELLYEGTVLLLSHR